ncbi:MAG: 50S ribosomal protein L13 [Candidatus Woesebacteria bacterium GW2011_GWA1_41_7]|uniref:Large ribosomal subunit protein uL13 n=1 Tax=Candidatus Woesebacteria bacterium GW2011_GWA1_41_7 TaxID=1618556 RepID=A0A0G0WZH7_9BACT|nr:MAG: 50S ribosomal protein L13 [Candidatus Woesebacteria bacterium GW2011_GWA1_41_7]
MKTFQPKESEVKRSWHLINAEDEILGRLSTKIAGLLMGKGKATYSRHMDSGDFVVVINAEKVAVTGRKASQKVYRTHSGYPSGFKEKSYDMVMEKHPERIIEHAVSGMIPDNRLKKARMLRLKVVAGDQNPYEKEFKKEEKAQVKL